MKIFIIIVIAIVLLVLGFALGVMFLNHVLNDIFRFKR